MNMILFDATECVGGTVVLRDARHEHVRTVLKSAVGDTLAVGEVNGMMGRAEVIAIDDASTTLRVTLTDAPPPALSVTLCLALPRPIMLRRVLFNAAQMGVKEIHLFHSNRVEKSFWQSSTLAQDQLEVTCREGLVQAKDTVMPAITLHDKFKPFVQDVLPELVGDRKLVVADPSGETTWPAVPGEPVVLVVGPEGGFIPYEVEQFMALDACCVSLGPRILRVETAVTTLLARL